MIASVGSMIPGASRSSTRTSPGPYITAPRTTVSLSSSSPSVVCPSGRHAGVVVGEVDRQLAVRVDLLEQEPGLLLDAFDGVLAGDPAQRRAVAVGELDERSGELGRVAGLPAVHRLPGRDRLIGALGVVIDRQ